MRTFAKLREMIASHKDLARKLAELEKKYDGQFKIAFEAIRQLELPEQPKRKIGFIARERQAIYQAKKLDYSMLNPQPLVNCFCEENMIMTGSENIANFVEEYKASWSWQLPKQQVT